MTQPDQVLYKKMNKRKMFDSIAKLGKGSLQGTLNKMDDEDKEEVISNFKRGVLKKNTLTGSNQNLFVNTKEIIRHSPGLGPLATVAAPPRSLTQMKQQSTLGSSNYSAIKM